MSVPGVVLPMPMPEAEERTRLHTTCTPYSVRYVDRKCETDNGSQRVGSACVSASSLARRTNGVSLSSLLKGGREAVALTVLSRVSLIIICQ